MPKAGEIKKNSAIDYNSKMYIVRDIERSVPRPGRVRTAHKIR